MSSIATKLLAVILACMLAGAAVMFLAFQNFSRDQRLSVLRDRLDGIAVTVGAALVEPMGKGDIATMRGLLQSVAAVPDLLRADLRDSGGTVIASVRGGPARDYRNTFTREVALVDTTRGDGRVLGRLVVTFHDGQQRRELAAQRLGSLAVLAVSFLLLAIAVSVAVSRLVARPLARLTESLRRNAMMERRDPLRWQSGDELGEVITAYNQLIAEIDQRSRDIHRLAYHDPLTGLPNRLLVEDRLGHALAVAERQDRSVAVLFADVDNFKVVNDTLGHKVGDELLRVVAERLSQALRSMDTVARWGGDEFVLVVESVASPGEAASISEKLIEAVGQPIDLGNTLLRTGISIGISLSPQDGADVTTLIKNADMALYEAKGRGRNTFHFFDQTLNARALRRLEIETALRQAIERGHLELHYQPKLATASGKLAGVEALVRWRRPGEGLIPPDQFIPVAEESDLIVMIGDWVLREACAQIRRWRARGLGDIPVAVNLSARHFRRLEDVDAIISVVDAAGVPAGLIEIEITESMLLHDPERVALHLMRLRTTGFGIAIDDFGTGYSNLGYLRRLPITTLKIDRAFVADLEQEEDDAEIVRTIVAMACALGLGLVAEGVETAGQLAFLRRCGCPVAQGYFLARPLPADELESFVTEHDPVGTRLRRAGREAPVLP